MTFDWVWAKDHGVVADGTTDDTTALQAAINATPDGGTLVLPIGTMKITSALTTALDIRIMGGSGYPGSGSTISQATDGDNGITQTAGTFLNLYGVVIISASHTIGGHGSAKGIYVLGDLTMEKSVVRYFQTGVFFATSDPLFVGYYSRIRDSWSDSNYVGIGDDSTGTHTYLNNLVVDGCRIVENTYGAYLSSGGYGMRLQNSTFETNSYAGIVIDGTASGQTAEGMVIHGCYFEQVAGTPNCDIIIGPNHNVNQVTISSCWMNGWSAMVDAHIWLGSVTGATLVGNRVQMWGSEPSVKGTTNCNANATLVGGLYDGAVTFVNGYSHLP